MTTTDGESLKSIKIPENGADEIEHEVVLRMDPEGFDFETKPKSTEASLVWQFKSVLKIMRDLTYLTSII